MNVQEATAKALLVDADALRRGAAGRRRAGANAVLMDAYNTDVRPLLAELREEMGLDPDPIAAYARSGYAEKIVAERVGGDAGRLGYLRTRRAEDADRRELVARSQPAGRRPAQHQLRRRQHLGQGHGHRPGHRRRSS